MKILVTGGAGFQGSHFAERMVGEGHEVTILSTPSQRAQENLKGFAHKVRVVWGSITDRELVRKAVRDQDWVAHFAARKDVDESIADPEVYAYVNTLGTINILESIKSGETKMLHISSCEVYGFHNDRSMAKYVSEMDGLFPMSPYAASKVAADTMCQAYNNTYRTKVVIARPVNVYGPRQRGGKYGNVIAIFKERAQAGLPLHVYGSGSQSREWIHVSDAVDAYQFMMESRAWGEVFNVTANERITINDIAGRIAHRYGVDIIYKEARRGEVPGFWLSSEKLHELGWEPRIPFSDGLSLYLDHKPVTPP